MLEVTIHKKLGSFTINVAFSSGDSGITAIFGPSGSGKTSVINMVAGLLKPDQGQIYFDSEPLFDSEKKINVPPNKRRLGYIFQDGRLFPHLSVRSNLTYGMNLIPKNGRRLGFYDVVNMLDLGDLLHRRPAKLSGGEKQRVAIGRALLTSPSLLLMDEPLSSLDGRRKSEILPFISKMQKKFLIPVLYVSHSTDEILSIADSVIVLRAGEVVFTGGLDIKLVREHPEFFPTFGSNNGVCG
ncbi:MAG: molybdenum ABC transporter ATP-binding protein [Deltaproteobacteria bacterium]|nr:molybdenum ABC transporter ATP-binding protein [Deltaproteobacteria bacterium]